MAQELSRPDGAAAALEPRRGRALAALALVCLASLGLSLWLIERHPGLYFNDGYQRLAYREQLLVWRWLPLLQAAINAVASVASGPEPVRWMLAALTALAAAGAYLLTARLFGRAAGLVAAAWFAGSLPAVSLATVPYQEASFVLQLHLLLWLLHRDARAPGLAPLPSRSRLALAGLMGHLLCLNRFEGWMLPGLAALEAGLRELVRGRRARALRSAGLAALAFGGAIAVAWIAFVPIDVQPRETAVGPRLRPGALLASTESLVRSMLREGGPAVCFFGAVGAALSLRDRAGRTTHVRTLAYFALYVALILAADPLPPGRKPFVLLGLLLPYAGHGAAWTARTCAGLVPRRGPRLAGAGLVALTLAVALVGAWRGAARTAIYARGAPEHEAVVRAARALRGRLAPRAIAVARNEGERRWISVHAWLPVERIVDAARAEVDAAALAGLAREHGELVVVAPAEAQDDLARAVRALEVEGGPVLVEPAVATAEGMAWRLRPRL